MREILFRGKRKDNGEWIEGSLEIDPDLELYEIKGFEYYTIWPEGPQRDYFDYAVIPETVGQYTGLTDKNGKKIFEGDILKIAQKSDGIGRYYFPPISFPQNIVFKYDMCAWLWEVIGTNKYYIHFPDAWCHYESEVIGNIHDNPELLQEVENNE